MDPFRGIVANVPDWLKRLDDLDGQIEQRQLDLARLEEGYKTTSPTRSLRNKGSTESLKPKDDGAAFLSPEQDKDVSTPPPSHSKPTLPRLVSSPIATVHPKTPPSPPRQTDAVVALAQRRARAAIRKKQKTESMVSHEGAAPHYRTRHMIIVYYDSYVQSFFEELVRFVSSSRNLMRKAKMAAKVAQIKRMAELEMPENHDPDRDLRPDALIPADPSHSSLDSMQLCYISTREMGPTTRLPGAAFSPMRGPYGGPSSLSGGLGLFNQGKDIYDEVDRGLEDVQATSERAAHQFLRDGECGEEVEKIKKRLKETREVAEKELERLLKENPNGLPEIEAAIAAPITTTTTRSYRPMMMRRQASSSAAAKMPTPMLPQLKVDDDEGIEDV